MIALGKVKKQQTIDADAKNVIRLFFVLCIVHHIGISTAFC